MNNHHHCEMDLFFFLLIYDFDISHLECAKNSILKIERKNNPQSDISHSIEDK